MGNINDLILIYHGRVNVSPTSCPTLWNKDAFAPYVTYNNPRTGKESWLFDGFLFLELIDGKGVCFNKGFTPKFANQKDWEWLFDRFFERSVGIDALDKSVEESEARIGAPPSRRKVVLTIPEPILENANWGDDAAGLMNFQKNPNARIVACKWAVDQLIQRWDRLQPKHLELAGFYWLAEYGQPFQDILPVIAAYIHSKGYKFYWIPSGSRSAVTEWRKLGFDYVWQQPNVYFDSKVPLSRLDEVCDFARNLHMGIEFEANRKVISDPATYQPRFTAYLDAFSRNGVKSGASMAYYEEGGLFRLLSKSKDPSVRALYDRIAQWVADRQERAASAKRP